MCVAAPIALTLFRKERSRVDEPSCKPGTEAGRLTLGRSASWRIQVVRLHEVYRSGYAQTLYMLLGAVGFVLLIAVVNVEAIKRFLGKNDAKRISNAANF
jgi:hypothetical protein